MPMAQSSLGSPGLLSAGARAAGDIAADRSFARDLTWTRSWPRSRVTARSAISPALFGRSTVFFVTHRFGFAEHFHRQQADSTLLLRAERQPDGRRDYKLAVKTRFRPASGKTC